MSDRLKAFQEFRERMSERLTGAGNPDITRVSTLDSRACERAALRARTKERLGQVSPPVLRRATATLADLDRVDVADASS